MRRIRIPLMTALFITVAGLGHAAQAAPGQAHTAAPATYYLALGDSYTAGFQAATVPIDRTCSDTKQDAAGQRGYVCLFWNQLKSVDPSIKLRNLAIPGDDTCSFLSITLCGGQARSGATLGDRPPYNFASESQMTAALKILKAHPGQVSPISLHIGGNDFLPLLGIALSKGVDQAKTQIPSVMQRLETNYDKIVSKLRAAAPGADLLLENQLNPLSGLPASALGAQGQEIQTLATSVLTQYNSFVKAEAAKYHAIYVDVYTPFLGKGLQLTWIVFNNDIHPNNQGYLVYDHAMWQAYTAAVQLKPVFNISLRLVHRPVKPGKTEKFVVTTLPHAGVTLVLKYAHRRWRRAGLANSAGTFKRVWHAPARHLLVHVRACARQGGAMMCAGTVVRVK